jgi:hypothetical protein
MEHFSLNSHAAVSNPSNGKCPCGFDPTSALARIALPVAETAHDMVIDHPDRLHKRVTDGRSNELEPSILQVFAHGV